MAAQEINETYKFRPTVRVQVALSGGAIVFGGLSFIMITTSMNTDSSLTEQIIHYSILLSFLVFLILSIYYLLKTKTVYIDNFRLKIKYPILFKTRHIDLNDISSQTIAPQIIKTSTRSGTMMVFEGKRIILEFKGGKSLVINSFSTQHFEQLCKLLSDHSKNIKPSSTKKPY